ncbi:TetR/AcrR family transcriptional regulator [Liquorilactobacillus mali]|uniref:HTH tetR-type domain-containing protein n=1 Tax=Liquorilactobacillus mali TaxID=1618 RepID=A0A0R2FSG7_9LACO|nr:TetR/AcrR family transcriptional regulator [Liquorilactobacillus mali]KRN28044.1 hypothetical protein IV36_GL000579 [Liquorilactobacillus mali]MDN7145903.1 TetR/AcrR family transcriptional regulator [Liquorilactobacillus mali]
MKRKITTNEIINAAIFILDQQGLEKVTLKNIATELNIKSPSLYNHIKSLDDILLQTARRSLENLYNNLVKSIIGLEKEKALLALSDTYRAFFKSHPGQYSLTQKVALWNKNNFSVSKSDEILQLVERILVGYNIKDENAIHFIRVWRSYMHGFLLLETNESFGLDTDIDESFTYGLKLLIGSLKE